MKLRDWFSHRIGNIPAYATYISKSLIASGFLF
nr:MAG TPA: hypothetical protein [Caudoviricetes sp.]